jgi:hypothetical protein
MSDSQRGTRKWVPSAAGDAVTEKGYTVESCRRAWLAVSGAVRAFLGGVGFQFDCVDILREVVPERVVDALVLVDE